MRGEPGRVAERVRALLEDYGRAPASPTSASSGGDGPAPSATVHAVKRRLRIDPGRRGALAVGVAVALAAALTGAWVLAARPSALPVSATSSGTASPAGGPSPTAWPAGRASTEPTTSRTSAGAANGGAAGQGAGEVVVDVAGKVRRPGLYRLPPGARVDDAVRAAGGALPGVKLDALNLAAKVVDGEQIAVGIAPAPGGGAVPPAGAAAGTAAAGSGPVNLNTASLEQLQTLPGVGPALAQHVLDWRAAHGGFRSVEQLNDVPGIGDVKFAALKSLVAV